MTPLLLIEWSGAIGFSTAFAAMVLSAVWSQFKQHLPAPVVQKHADKASTFYRISDVHNAFQGLAKSATTDPSHGKQENKEIK